MRVHRPKRKKPMSTERDPLTLATEALARHNFDLDWGGDASFDNLNAEIKRSWLSEALAQAKVVAEHFQPRTVTTVEELDKLPVGSIVAMIGSEPDSPAVACRAVRGWQFLGEDPERRYLSSSLMPAPEPITVLHHPGADS